MQNKNWAKGEVMRGQSDEIFVRAIIRANVTFVQLGLATNSQRYKI